MNSDAGSLDALVMQAQLQEAVFVEPVVQELVDRRCDEVRLAVLRIEVEYDELIDVAGLLPMLPEIAHVRPGARLLATISIEFAGRTIDVGVYE